MLWKINDALKSDPLISEKVETRIKFYEYPENGDISGPCIVIEPIAPPKPSDFADNQWIKEDYLYQIEVWSNHLSDTQSIAKQIQKVMWEEFGFTATGAGVDEWDKDFNIYRDARRYRGKVYTI